MFGIIKGLETTWVLWFKHNTLKIIIPWWIKRLCQKNNQKRCDESPILFKHWWTPNYFMSLKNSAPANDANTLNRSSRGCLIKNVFLIKSIIAPPKCRVVVIEQLSNHKVIDATYILNSSTFLQELTRNFLAASKTDRLKKNV